MIDISSSLNEDVHFIITTIHDQLYKYHHNQRLDMRMWVRGARRGREKTIPHMGMCIILPPIIMEGHYHVLVHIP